MSYEILLIAGDPSASARDWRAKVLASAAGRVPGSVSWSMHENSHATLALVRTAPDHGTFAQTSVAPSGTLVVISTSNHGADDLATGRKQSRNCGAEAAHVKVLLGRDGQVEIDADSVGFIPSFWSSRGADLWFGTHLASLVSLGVSAVGDDVGMLEYLVMLHPLRDRTILADVALLAAGGRLDKLPGARPVLSVQRLYAPVREKLRDDEAIEEFGRVWSAVMSDMIGRIGSARPGLGLSGGLDSRAIAEECVNQQFHPLTFTYGVLGTAEGHASARVAEALELDHAIIPVTSKRMLNGASDATTLLDGAHSPAEMYELWFIDRLRSFADVLVNGLAGGPLWGDDKALGLIGLDAVLDAQLRRYAPELARLRAYLSPEVAQSAKEQLRISLRDSMAEWDMSSRSDMTMFWKIHNRQIRWGNPLTGALRRSGLRVEAPFMDSRFLRFSAMLTPEQRQNGHLYLKAHQRFFGRTSSIPRDSDGNPPEKLNHVYWSGESSYARQLALLARRHPVSAARRAARQIEAEAWGRVPNGTRASALKHRNESRRSVFPADTWLRTRTAYRDRLLELLEASPAVGILSELAVARLVDDLRTQKQQTGALLIAKIGTLQAWFADYAQRHDEYQRLA